MKIYNSLARNKEEFSPIKKGKIGMYVCGPTVYDEPHIGHARSAYIFDVIRRYFVYRGYKVTFVRNVTDVDDKIIEKARKELGDRVSGLGFREKVVEVSKKYLSTYHEDMALLGIGKPDKEPKATEYIPKMVKFIELLIKKECAYETDGDVYFDIKKAKDYGKLSNQNLDKMKIGARISPGENKKNPLDFALWKKARGDEPSWKSPWGEGRPGWHIECSVMSSDILGSEFDIHGGGVDLIFPHHENEIAQSEGAGKRFARCWIHNGLLTINGEKMAKSLGNFKTIREVLKDLPDANGSDILKILFLWVHYSNPLDFSSKTIKEAKEAAWRLLEPLRREPKIKNLKDLNSEDKKYVDDIKQIFENVMDDDFNTPRAQANIFGLVRHCNHLLGAEKKDQVAIQYTINMIKTLCSVLGLSLNQLDPHDPKWGDLSIINILREEVIKDKIQQRNEAREAKDFNKADQIRKELFEQNIILEDAKDGTTWRRKL